MKAVFCSDVPVRYVVVFAEMAWMERRPELGLLCCAARDQGNRITVATVQSVLPGLFDAGASNVIAWCQMLGLCDAEGGLTALGEDVAESDEVPVPEQGVYGLWLARHPVIGNRVLAAERLASTRDQRFESIQPLAVELDRGKVFRSVVDPKERFMVRNLPTNHGQPGGMERATRATCRLRWTLDFDSARDQWQLEGTIEVANGKSMQPMQHEPESNGLDLWKLVATWATGPLSAFGRWQANERRLALSFERIADAEIDTFCKTLSLQSVEIPGKGIYKNVTLEDMPVGPASAEDAQRWALSRFDRRLTARPGYRSRAEVRELFAELTEGTPLERFEPTLPAHHDLLARAAKDPERFWTLAAPVDLAPYPPTHDDLGSLRIAAPTPTPTVEPDGVVRVPYRGGWSMRRLVDRLLAGIAPRKVLLCDRYVRGENNLDTLKILVATLRASAPSVIVDMWTGDEAADFKAIHGITGTAPRRYRDVFGQSAPHDRYLLVLAGQGQGFGWQLSNSPLHARVDVKSASPETPLRWKDLVATRVTADELEPRLRQWLVGGA